MRIFVDTNLLTRGAQPAHPMYQTATDAVAALLARGDELCLVPQNFYEFWTVCTRPEGENGLGLPPAQAHTEFGRLRQLFRSLPDKPELFAEWESIVTRYEVKGKNAHDARLFAAMTTYGVQHLLTFNKRDFARYGVTIMTPQEVVLTTSMREQPTVASGPADEQTGPQAATGDESGTVP